MSQVPSKWSEIFEKNKKIEYNAPEAGPKVTGVT